MVIEPLEVMSQKVNQAELWLWTSDILSWLCAMDYFPGAYTGGKTNCPLDKLVTSCLQWLKHLNNDKD